MSMTGMRLAIASVLILMGSACSPAGSDELASLEILGSPVAAVDTSAPFWVDSLAGSRPPIVVRATPVEAFYWPEDPEVGVWYQLAERIYHCDSELHGPTDEDTVYVSSRPDDWVARDWAGGYIVIDDGYDSLEVGIGRLTPDGRIEYSDDGSSVVAVWSPNDRPPPDTNATCD